MQADALQRGSPPLIANPPQNARCRLSEQRPMPLSEPPEVEKLAEALCRCAVTGAESCQKAQWAPMPLERPLARALALAAALAAKPSSPSAALNCPSSRGALV